MIARIIEWSLHNRAFVLLVTAMLALGGLWALRTTPIDAIPDLSDVQVIVITDVPGQAPQVVEDQVTTPLSAAMLAVPHAQDVRGYSFFGLSLLYVIFDDGTDLYWARSRVLEYLNTASERLPEGVVPRLGPDATGVGWIYQYVLTDSTPRARLLRAALDVDGSGVVELDEVPGPQGTGYTYRAAQLQDLLADGDDPVDAARHLTLAFDKDDQDGLSPAELRAAANFAGVDLAELRSLQDYYLRYDLMSLDGVAEIAAVGGFVKQYQVEVDPERLRAYGVTLGQVKTAIQRANQDVGGRMLEQAETEFMVRGEGYITSVDDLLTVPVKVAPTSHTPVLLRQVARVVLGPEVRRGLVDWNGQGEVVSGIVLLRVGENAQAVVERVEQRLEELRPGLPPGVELHASYDRTKLIQRAIDTLTRKLTEELLAVVLICSLFLLHVRSALVAVITIPVGVLISFLLMRLVGLNANIMSLGGIAIAVGVMVDAAVVMVENLHKHRERRPDADHWTRVRDAAVEVGPALFYSLLIVTVSFLPVFTLQQQEGRLFAPLAWTKTFALGASAVLAVTLIPVLMHLFVRGRTPREDQNPLARLSIAAYRPILEGTLKAPWLVIMLALALAGATLLPLKQLGSEFMPPLNEGDLLYMPTTPPGLSITKARELLHQTDKLIATHPQVDQVLGKIGRAETATDPAPLTMIETTILLTDPDTWPEGQTIEGIARELDARVQLPGVTNAWTMPIKTRIDMLATGIKTPVGIKLLGDDLAELDALGQQIEAVVAEVEGASSVYSERVTGGNFIDITVRRSDAARYGLNVADVQDVVKSAIGGMNVTWTVEGLERYPVNLRFPRELRNDLQSLRRVAVPTPLGHTVPLGQVADVTVEKGPPAVKSENARRTAWIYVDLETSDIGGFVDRARQAVDEQVVRPAGVSLEWSGQYEYMQRANERLAVVVPLTLGIIFVLLYLHFTRVAETVMVMAGTLVFAPIGGIWFLWLADFNLSVAVGVGFIALAGLAAETGVVMLVYLDEAIGRYRREGRLTSVAALHDAIREGAVDRVRPKIMSVTTTIIGLLPILWGTETGVRVTKRIAAPMVGGLVSSTVLTLVVLPALYLVWKRVQLREELS